VTSVLSDKIVTGWFALIIRTNAANVGSDNVNVGHINSGNC